MRGGTGAKTLAAIRTKLEDANPTDPLLVMTTVPYGGEGFDAPVIDTVFLVGPISYPGLLKQAVGRALRRYEGKTDVVVQRLRGYRGTRPECPIWTSSGWLPADGVYVIDGLIHSPVPRSRNVDTGPDLPCQLYVGRLPQYAA